MDSDELERHIGETVEIVAECPICGQQVRIGSHGSGFYLEPHGYLDNLQLRCTASGAYVTVNDPRRSNDETQ